jgi:hypothetical protein
MLTDEFLAQDAMDPCVCECIYRVAHDWYQSQILEPPFHHYPMRFGARRRWQAMDKLSIEGHVVYELLRHEIINDMDQKLQAHGESLLQSMSKMMEANNATLDSLMSVRANGIHGELALNLGQIKVDLYK